MEGAALPRCGGQGAGTWNPLSLTEDPSVEAALVVRFLLQRLAVVGPFGMCPAQIQPLLDASREVPSRTATLTALGGVVGSWVALRRSWNRRPASKDGVRELGWHAARKVVSLVRLALWAAEGTRLWWNGGEAGADPSRRAASTSPLSPLPCLRSLRGALGAARVWAAESTPRLVDAAWYVATSHT